MFLLAADSQFIYETISDNGVVTVGYRLWVYASIFLVAGIVAIAGWFYRKSDARILIIGVCIFVLLAPTFMLDGATIDETGMTLQTGIWSGSSHQFRYDDIQAVHLTETTHKSRDGVVEHHESMYCDTANGSTEEVRVSARISKTAFKHFIREIERRKIPIVDHRTEKAR